MSNKYLKYDCVLFLKTLIVVSPLCSLKFFSIELKSLLKFPKYFMLFGPLLMTFPIPEVSSFFTLNWLKSFFFFFSVHLRKYSLCTFYKLLSSNVIFSTKDSLISLKTVPSLSVGLSTNALPFLFWVWHLPIYWLSVISVQTTLRQELYAVP